MILMEPPVLVKPIPAQVVNEHAAFGPFNLLDYIQTVEGDKSIRFSAELKNGDALPRGMICTSDGIITGIPAKGTEGQYEIIITAANEAGSIKADLILNIKPSLSADDIDYLSKLKSQIWQALEKRLPIPDLQEMYDRPINALDIYYLLERWGILTIWNAYDLDPPQDKKLLNLPGLSEHYLVYDRGSSLVGCPKDLFSHERTLEDGLKMARAMAKEVYNRGWTIEMAGFEKLTRAVWVEVQRLADQYGKPIEVINFNPTENDIKLYTMRAQYSGPEKGIE